MPCDVLLVEVSHDDDQTGCWYVPLVFFLMIAISFQEGTAKPKISPINTTVIPPGTAVTIIRGILRESRDDGLTLCIQR
jgi:hypothetical protein